MLQARPMAKDLMFKLRLDAEDRDRLDAVAEHYSAPAATAIRMLIKEKYDELRPKAGDQLELTLGEPAENEHAPAKIREAAAKWRKARRAFMAWKSESKDEPRIHALQAKRESELLATFRAYHEKPSQPQQTLARAYDSVRDFYFKTMDWE
jgi:hypothetical protein